MLAIIPARGGSKGLPGKNIKTLAGQPLIAYTIKAALRAGLVSRVIVSTDSEEIAETARKYGAEVPFMRPAELASDTANAMDAFFHVLERLRETENVDFESFVVLQPTSPLRTAADIDSAIRLFEQKKAKTVLSVTDFPHPPVWAQAMNKNKQITPFFGNENLTQNRQNQKNAYLPNGAVYVFDTQFLKTHRSYFSAHTYGYYMPPERSVDIDTALDFIVAQALLHKKQNHVVTHQNSD